MKILFESEHINFVNVSEDLIFDYLEMVNDIEVQKYISNNRHAYTYEDEVNWVDRKLKEKALVFSMIEKDTDEFIGNIEIMDIKNNVAEMGISITRRKQDKHFGEESIKRLIKYAFETLNLDALELNVFDFNPRGIRCYEKCGFKKDGLKGKSGEIHMIIKNTNK